MKIKNRSLQVGDAAAPIAAPYDVNASDTSISQSAEKSTGSAKKVSENSDKISKSARKSGDFEAKLSDDSDKVTISKGQAQKLAANYNSDRVYDKKDVVTAFRGIEGFANLPEDMQKELLRDVWVGMNSRYGKGARETFVEVMSNKIPYMLLTEAYTEENAKEYGRLQSAKKRAKKTLEGEALKEKLEAIDRELEKLENVPDRLFDTYEQSRIDEINREIAEALNKLLDGGKPSLRSKIEGEFDASDAGKWKTKYYEARGRAKKLLNLSYQVQKMRDLKLGTFLNATDYKNEIFRETFDILGSINFRGNISPKTVRRAMARLAEWYAPDNPVLAEIDGQPGTRLFSDYIAIEMNSIASGEGELSMHELDMLDNILRHATNIVENFNRVWKDGKWVEADKTAKAMIEVADETNVLRRSGDMRRLGKRLGRWFKKYTTTFADPMTLFRYMDGYGNGFWTQMGEELRQAAFKHGIDLMEMKADYDAFNNGHKKYVKNASREVVEYGGAKMTKLQFMSLYMTMHRDQAARGLAENGFSFIDTDGNRVEVEGYLARAQERLGSETGIKKSSDGVWEISDEQMKTIRESEISEMKKLLSDEDLKYIGIIEKTLNGRCKELKSARDMERLGFSNTISGYYYPIVRAMIAQNIDKRGMWGELDRASNISANKNTVKGAAGALWIESCDTVFNRHIDAVARYAELSPVIDTINKLFNLDVSGNKNKPRSIRTATFNSWQTGAALGAAQSDAQKHNGEAYLKELLSDVQGIGRERSVGNQLVENLRGGFAISALAGNPKVLFTQLSSVFASANILSKSSLMMGIGRGFGKDVGAELDKYCPVAKLRNYDSAAAKAQGVLDEVRGVGELLMKPIGFMDRQVVKMLWGAAQVEAEKTTKHKIGTEENKVEAGKILERVIFETQQNSVATEKSAAMRSTNMLMRSLTMFTSDAMKAVGRVIDAFGEVLALKARIKRLRAEVGGEKNGSPKKKMPAIDESFATFIDSVRKMARKDIAAKRQYKISNISNTHATLVQDIIKRELGVDIDLSDYSINISGDSILHIDERHGANGSADSSMATTQDMTSIGWAVNNADTGRVAKKQNGAIDYSTVYKNEDNTAAPKIILETELGDGQTIVVVECVPDSVKKKIHIISARKIKSGNGQVLNVESSDSPQPTSETPLDYPAANDSITENGENVNSEAKKSKDEQLKSLEAQLKNAKAQARRSVGALAMTALYMTLIARAFSRLYKKEEDEEDSI